MKTFNSWKDDHLKAHPEDKNLSHNELYDKFNDYIKTCLKKTEIPIKSCESEDVSSPKASIAENNSNSDKDEYLKKIESQLNEMNERQKKKSSQFRIILVSVVVLFGGYLFIQHQNKKAKEEELKEKERLENWRKVWEEILEPKEQKIR